LNYGHTIGHALESLGGYKRLIHGEAVGIGLVAEADLAAYLGFCGKDVAARIRRLVQAAGLPDLVPSTTSFHALWGAMQHDKKVSGGRVVGVWPVRIGEVVIRPLEQEACADWFRTREARPKSGKPVTRKT
jgi:3-dehydroquinate synthase